ncbi:MAG: HigA family addiction module antitoxin [Acidimicrobiales bacterium]
MMANVLVPAETFPPGEYLRDELEERGWTEKEFAEILGRPVQAISEILNGRKQIIPETALAIGEALGTSAELWVNLQTAFDLHEAKSGRPLVTDVTRRSRLREWVPVAELKQRGWLPDTKDIDQLEKAVQKLLGTTDSDAEPWFAVAARRSNCGATFTPQQTAWLSQVRRLASERTVANFDKKATVALASDLAHRIHDPTELGQLEGWLADCGVALLTLLPLKSSKLDGAAMLLDDGTPAIGLTSRGDRMDGYVFTLLHELAHLCLGHLDPGGVCADEDLIGLSEGEGREAEANHQASEWIFPEDPVLPGGRPPMSKVLQVAWQCHVHPSFVIGRIQRERDDWGYLRRSIPRVRPFVETHS